MNRGAVAYEDAGAMQVWQLAWPNSVTKSLRESFDEFFGLLDPIPSGSTS
jgi:hypothetical protein